MRSWRTWPLRAWVLVGALVVFSVAILSVLYWAQFTGRAGSQRGLVIHNDLTSTTFVEINETPKRIDDGEEQTFVITREDFPTEIKVYGAAIVCDGADTQDGCGVRRGLLISSDMVDYRYIADAEFRLSIDEQGLHPTATYRDTPVPATETAVTP